MSDPVVRLVLSFPQDSFWKYHLESGFEVDVNTNLGGRKRSVVEIEIWVYLGS